VPLPQSLAFNFSDFLDYLKALLTKGTFGFSDVDYPQTVQYFILASFPHSFYNFLLIFTISLGSLGVFLFFLTTKKEMKRNFSELSFFLHMDRKKILRQAWLAALPKQILFWNFLSPAIFVILLFLEAKFKFPGLGNTIITAFELKDYSLFYGSSICAFIFILTVSIFFLTLKNILLRK
jgi:ABC-type dipeptide/oligopeptide/nickel transport system permease component